MKGLLRNSFYGAKDSFIVLLVMLGALGIGVVVSGNATLLNIFGFPCVTVFAVVALSSYRKEAATNWNKYIVASPVKRHEIIKSRYMYHLMCLGVGTALLVVVVGLAVLKHGNRFFYQPVRDPLTLLCISVGIPLLLGSLFYPMATLIGIDKSEVVLIISLLGSIGITAGIVWLVNISFGNDSVNDFEYFAGMAAFIGISLLLFVGSYYVSLTVNRKKEY